MEIGCLGKCLKEEGCDEHDKCQDDGDERAIDAVTELAGNDLYAILKVDPRNVESKGVAGEEGNISQKVTPYDICMKHQHELGA